MSKNAELRRAWEARLTADRVRELLDYDPDTGEFRWKVRRGYLAQAGSVAGRITRDGYRWIKINSRDYTAARLAFAWMTGGWPAAEIDHKNRIAGDNRWANLRDVTRSENAANTKRSNTSGMRGVRLIGSKGKWLAEIGIAGKTRNLGRFTNKNDAALAYNAAALAAFGEFAILNIFPQFMADLLINSIQFLRRTAPEGSRSPLVLGPAGSTIRDVGLIKNNLWPAPLTALLPDERSKHERCNLQIAAQHGQPIVASSGRLAT